MSALHKPFLRLAAAIHARLASHRHRDQLAELPQCSWDCCAELAGKVRRAELRGWHLAAAELRRDLACTVRTLQSELSAMAAQLSAMTTTESTATFGDVYEDLLALQADFDAMDFDLRQQRLSVTTEPITLQGIYLGPFEIQLDWGRAGGESAYRILAVEPHPAESRDNCTHPHVLDEILCEGHSRHAIRQALAQGRLLDFFTLVANGLRTYNEESPFVALEVWHGQTCADCGAVIDDDDRYCCQGCEETVCGGCETGCCGCGDSYCSQCSSACEACGDNFCRRCLKCCQQCRVNVCPGCLEEDERCCNCHEEDRPEEESTSASPDRTAVQPLCVGQAAVSA